MVSTDWSLSGTPEDRELRLVTRYSSPIAWGPYTRTVTPTFPRTMISLPRSFLLTPPPSPVTRVEPPPSRTRGARARGPDGRDQRPPHGPSGLEERLARQLAALSSQARVYFDDMERGANGWTTQAYGEDDLWHQTHTSFSSPSTSWWCALEPKGSYDTGRRIQTAAVSPTIDLVGRGAPITLQFFENYNTEQGWDFCMVDVSADGGKDRKRHV